jgi:3-hydroxyisobutyrate dehydrogenase-like beta-hydroxyacid dehydrogenase
LETMIGIVGYGEAGAAIAAGLAEAGATVVAYDARLEDGGGDQLRDRAATDRIDLATDLADLAGRCPVIVSLVTSSAALPVAEVLAPHLGPEHLFADANSTSPGLAAEVATVIGRAGAQAVDVAIMAAVPPNRQRVPMLASGPGARRFAELGFGTDIELVDGPPGAASAVKMLRSLLVKGLESLLVEFAIASRRFGATADVLRSLDGTLPMERWEELASYLLTRTALHGERRGHELEEAAAMLRELGIEPLLAEAGAKRLLWAAARGVEARFEDAPPTHYDEVIDALFEPQEPADR